MGRFHELISTTLATRSITEAEVPLIEKELHHDGRLDVDDVKFLIQLYCDGDNHCRSFQDLFFEVLERVILEDGEIQPSEQYYLLKMLYSDRVVRDCEKQFLTRIRGRANAVAPEFARLCDEAMGAESGVRAVGDA